MKMKKPEDLRHGDRIQINGVEITVDYTFQLEDGRIVVMGMDIPTEELIKLRGPIDNRYGMQSVSNKE